MKRGFAPVLIILLCFALLTFGISYALDNKSKAVETSIIPEPSTFEHSPFNPTTYSPLPSTSSPSPSPNCPKNQIGDIKFTPPVGWVKEQEKRMYSCRSVYYVSPGSETVYAYYPTNGAILSVTSDDNLVGEDSVSHCKLDEWTVEPIECTTFRGNRLDKYYVNYEGRYLIYQLTYKNKYYNFKLGTNLEEKFKPELEKLIDSVELH